MASASAASRVRDAAPLFAALGDETRLRLIMRLSSGGPGSITQLSAKSDVSRQAITKHLRVLSDAGLVRSTRKGREQVWDLEPKRLADAHEYLDRISQQWDAALDRLKAFVED
ncbi:MAG: transcriptional regulator, ArsR family [Gemmatimonadetes bacterium]|nr:transcriptional regulator, ArsR family [Gemmatimonadota bacterium]